ncbi:hypothetical protein [Listeria seeligeri]|uniref:hypothetical protein n=1 Tax=Listeria seeligeri TaxID=1640 RepID=UPI0022EC1137|nr:hypothetical protein [Listeria seeligeri]
MSTRAFIIQKIDNQFKGIYLHFDGFIDYTGVILQQAYNTEEKVTKLVQLGSCSVLGYSTEPPEVVRRYGFNSIHSEAYRQLDKEEQERLEEEYYSQAYSIFYHRDRQETLDVFSFESIEEITNDRSMIAYTYIFMNGKWYVLDNRGHLKSLKRMLQLEKIAF